MNTATKLNGTVGSAKPLPRMSLSNIQRGVLEKPLRVVLYGVEGIGKSTFAANAPNPIFLGPEDGTAQLDVARFAEAHTFDDVLEAIRVLSHEEHDYQTLVLDTLDWIEPILWTQVCKEGGKVNIEDFGYGKGYVAALDSWRILGQRLNALREQRRMHILMLGHCMVRTFHNPEGEDFDRYQLKLQEKAAGFIKEWADCVLFANWQTFTKGKEGKVKGIASGARTVHTERRAAWDAKNRFELPLTIPLNWEDFFSAVRAHRPASPDKLRAEILEHLPQVPDEKFRETVTAWLAKPDVTPTQLAQALDRVKAKAATNEGEVK